MTKQFVRDPKAPPSIFDKIVACCNRPYGVCCQDPCAPRKEYWKQVAMTPPGLS